VGGGEFNDDLQCLHKIAVAIIVSPQYEQFFVSLVLLMVRPLDYL
jgi:hypothetical protein